MRDTLYGISSRDVEGYETLARQARSEDDEELAGFFERVGRDDRRLAREAERLLAERVPE